MTTLTNHNCFQQIIKHWKHIASFVHEPQSTNDYEKLSCFLDQLLDIVGENESHELIGLVDVVSHMITMYDEVHSKQLTSASGINALKYLMQQHQLKQTDLKEIGSQGVVSEILNGKRKLNLSQIKKLSERFHVSPSTFIDVD